METIKTYIFEKLKISSKAAFIKPTNQEFYDLLFEYCQTNKINFLDVGLLVHNDADLLPRYETFKNRVIFGIYPIAKDNEIVVITKDFETLTKQSIHNISLEHEGDKPVYFMNAEWIEKTVKYMEEHIK